MHDELKPVELRGGPFHGRVHRVQDDTLHRIWVTSEVSPNNWTSYYYRRTDETLDGLPVYVFDEGRGRTEA